MAGGGCRRNPLTWVALVVLGGLQWLTVSLPPLSRLLGTVPLAMADCLVLAIGVLWPVLGMEMVKSCRGGPQQEMRLRSGQAAPAPPLTESTRPNH